MADDGSITQWVARLKEGESAAAQPLWERFYKRLTALARQRLRGAPRGMADEDDVVVTAFDSFCRGAAEGKFPRLSDRHDLWQLLVVLTIRKATKVATKERRQKRGGGAVLDEAALNGPAADTDAGRGLEQVADTDADPAFAAQVADQLRDLLARLDEPVLRIIALRKLEGYENTEIAAELGCAVRSVERKLQRIRGLWSGVGKV